MFSPRALRRQRAFLPAFFLWSGDVRACTIPGMWTSIDNSLCELGESPFWHPRERALYWLDIPGRAVLRTRGDIGTDSAKVERWALSTEPGCMAPARSGGLVIALRDGIYRAREWGGELVAIARVDHDVRTMRFNDGKCDALGRFWSGSINEAKDRANAALYCLDARPGSGVAPALTQMANQVTTANGLAFSPDARTLYWADTPAHQVRAWNWDAAANTLSQPRVFHQFDAKPEGWTPIRRRCATKAAPMAPRSMHRATTGSRCSKVPSCCALRLRARSWPPFPCRPSAPPCPASAATT